MVNAIRALSFLVGDAIRTEKKQLKMATVISTLLCSVKDQIWM